MSLGEKDSSQVLGFLADKGDYYTKLAIIERKRQADLNDAIEHIRQETENYRSKAKSAAIAVMNQHAGRAVYKRADGADIGKQAIGMTSKMLSLLEVKLNKLCQRKSEVINYNNGLKLEIDHYRRMRLQTDISHAKFDIVLKSEKEKIEEWLSQSAAVVEQREALVREKEKLEAINVEEQRVFMEEYESIGTFIKEQNAALEEALLRERKAEKAGKGLDESLGAANESKTALSLQEEVEMARQVGSLSNFMATEKNSLSSIQDRITMYEVMFDQLKKMTGANSLNEVIADYINHEEEMFSLYNFIQAVNAEIEAVVETRNQIEEDIRTFKAEQSEQDNLRRDKLDQLQRRLDSTVEMTRQCEEQNKEMHEVVGTISKKVSSLFFKLQCDQMDTRGNQGGSSGIAGGKPVANKSSGASRPESKIALLLSQGVGEGNVLEYMGFVEQRAVDVISDYLHQQDREGHNANRVGPRSPTPGPSSPMHWPAMPVVDISDLGEDDLLMDKDGGDDDAAFKPVDISTFKDKLQKKLGLHGSTFPNSKPTTPAKTPAPAGGNYSSTKHKK